MYIFTHPYYGYVTIFNLYQAGISGFMPFPISISVRNCATGVRTRLLHFSHHATGTPLQKIFEPLISPSNGLNSTWPKSCATRNRRDNSYRITNLFRRNQTTMKIENWKMCLVCVRVCVMIEIKYILPTWQFSFGYVSHGQLFMDMSSIDKIFRSVILLIRYFPSSGLVNGLSTQSSIVNSTKKWLIDWLIFNGIF